MQLESDLWGLNEEKSKKYNVAYNTSTDKKVYNSKEYHAWSYMLRLVYEDNERFRKKEKVVILRSVMNGLILRISMNGLEKTIIQLAMRRWIYAEIF